MHPPIFFLLSSAGIGIILMNLVFTVPELTLDKNIIQSASELSVSTYPPINKTLSTWEQTPPSPIKHSGSTLPEYLYIPKIQVEAQIEHIGLTPQGAMDVPLGKNNAGWFDQGPRPGEPGSALIDGHYGVWKSGNISVFNDLHKLRKGDTLYVKDRAGKTITFVVTQSKILDDDADATEIFSSKDNGSHLNLITCQGVWNNNSKKYPSRLVVFSDRVP